MPVPRAAPRASSASTTTCSRRRGSPRWRSSGSATGRLASAATAASPGPGSCGSRTATRPIACAPTSRATASSASTATSSMPRRSASSRRVSRSPTTRWRHGSPESGYADPSMTAGSFMRAARDRGARLVQGAAVTAIPVEGGRVRGVVTSAGAIDAPVVVNAAGGWAGTVAGLAGLDLPLTVWRHDTGYLGVPASVPRPIPVVIDIPNEMYFRPEGGELVLIGLEDDNQMGGDPDRETATAAVAFHDRAAERIVRRVPGLIDGTFRTSHSGQDGLTTTDQRPLLGPAGPDGLLPRLRPQRDGLQDVPGGRPRDGRVDPRRRAPIRGPGAVRVHARGGGPHPRGRARRRTRLALISRPRPRRPGVRRLARDCSGCGDHRWPATRRPAALAMLLRVLGPVEHRRRRRRGDPSAAITTTPMAAPSVVRADARRDRSLDAPR